MKEKKEHEHNEDFDGFTLTELDKQFSKLTNELRNKGVPLESVMEVNQRMEEPDPHFRDYNPTVLDFLERAKTEEECKEVIAFCLKKKELTQDEADNLLDRLEKGGPSAFGTRESGYYDSKL